jgi:hypothetical protein
VLEVVPLAIDVVHNTDLDPGDEHITKWIRLVCLKASFDFHAMTQAKLQWSFWLSMSLVNSCYKCAEGAILL